MTAPILIVWNGCDGYTETTALVHYNRADEFHAFRVVPASIEEVPVDEDGEKDFTGLLLTDTGNLYRKARTIPFRDVHWQERLKIRQICEDTGSQLDHIIGEGFRVAIGRGRLSHTCHALELAGYACIDSHAFPLGYDEPADHLRHDHNGSESSCWLFATFISIG